MVDEDFDVLCTVEDDFGSVVLVYDYDLGLGLFVDSINRFYARSEHRHNETLAVVPFVYGTPRSIFVIGAEDGLAIMRLLRFSAVDRVIHHPLRPQICALARDHLLLRRLNADSLSDPRIETHRGKLTDAVIAARGSDLILIDLPPLHADAAIELCTVEFIRACANALSSDGGMLHIRSDYHARTFGGMTSTVRHVFEHVLPARNISEQTGHHGFHLACQYPLKRCQPVPDWTRHLTEELVAAQQTFPRDRSALLSAVEVNAENDLPLLRDALLLRYVRAWDYRHAPDTVLIEDTCFTPHLKTFKQLELLITTLRRTRNVVIYVRERNHQLSTYVRRLGGVALRTLTRMEMSYRDDSLLKRLRERLGRMRPMRLFGHRELLHCRPREHAGLADLITGYLDSHKAVVLDQFGQPDALLEDKADYYYYEAHGGRPVGFVKGITGAVREAEIIYGRGSARQNTCMMLDAFVAEAHFGYESLEMNVPYPAVVSMLKRFGVEQTAELIVYVLPKNGAAQDTW